MFTPEALRKQCGQVPAAVFNAFSLVQAPMGCGHMASLASNDARRFGIFCSCSDGIAGRYARPLRTDLRAGRSGCVQSGAEGGGRGPPLRIKWQVAKQFTISKKHPIVSQTNQLTRSTTKKMFIRFSTLLPVAALVAVAAAAPGALEARTDSSSCNTGSQQCCVTTQTVRIFPPHAFTLCANHGPRCSRPPQRSTTSADCLGSPFPLSTVSSGSAAPRSRLLAQELVLLAHSSPSVALTIPS